MADNGDRISFKFLRLVEGEAVGRYGISALVVVVLICGVSLALR